VIDDSKALPNNLALHEESTKLGIIT
jgi:hypothetical protein